MWDRYRTIEELENSPACPNNKHNDNIDALRLQHLQAKMASLAQIAPSLNKDFFVGWLWARSESSHAIMTRAAPFSSPKSSRTLATIALLSSIALAIISSCLSWSM